VVLHAWNGHHLQLHWYPQPPEENAENMSENKTFTHKPQGSIQLNSFNQKIVDYDALCKTYIFCHNIGVFNKVLPATMPRENLSQLATLTRE
jgi:hypothetical protein